MNDVLTVLALTDTVINATVVVLRKTDHIEEHTVERVIGDGLFKDFVHVLLLIAAHQARVYLAVVIDMLPVLADVQPLGILDGVLLVDLAEIEATDHFHARGMEFRQNGAEKIAFHMRVSPMVFQLSRIIGDNAAHVEQHNVGPELLDLAHVLIRVHGRVDLSEIGLDHTVRCQPPIGLTVFLSNRDRCHRCHDAHGKGKSSAHCVLPIWLVAPLLVADHLDLVRTSISFTAKDTLLSGTIKVFGGCQRRLRPLCLPSSRC